MLDKSFTYNEAKITYIETGSDEVWEMEEKAPMWVTFIIVGGGSLTLWAGIIALAHWFF